MNDTLLLEMLEAKTVKKFSTRVVETQDQKGAWKEVRKLEFHRTKSPPLKWELIASSEFTTRETLDEFTLTYAERRFLEKEEIPTRCLLLPQYAVLVNQWRTQRNEWRFVDFVLVGKDDLAPIVAFEIDGATHQHRMVFDALRDKEISEQLDCPIVHVSNTKLQAKKIFAYVEHWHIQMGMSRQARALHEENYWCQGEKEA